MIRVEFYGIPRLRSGVDFVDVDAQTLGEVFQQLKHLGSFARDCLTEEGLKAGYLASLNGREFTTDPARNLQAGDVVLILSSDVGG